MDGSWKPVEIQTLAGVCGPGSALKGQTCAYRLECEQVELGDFGYTHHQ